jgi:hypothetical protein
VKDADGVGPAADARGHRIGQPTGLVLNLCVGLEPDHPLKVAHHQRKWMRPSRGTEAVVRLVGVGHPIPERLVDRVLERLGAGLHRHHFGSKQPHPGDVQRLAGGVDRAHVDHTVKTEKRTRRGGRHSVLTGPGLGDDPLLAHLARQQRLTEHIVDLVRPGVVQIFSFQEDARAAGVLAQACCFVQG